MPLDGRTEDEAEVWSRLAEVSDPELDESIVVLGFVASADVSDGHVVIRFRLPTYWCSPNFAFLMACDIRDRVSELAWVRVVRVELLDHCTAESINDGIASRRSFEEMFRDETTGDLVQLRLLFRRKAFMARQERLLKQLLGAGWVAEVLVST